MLVMVRRKALAAVLAALLLTIGVGAGTASANAGACNSWTSGSYHYTHCEWGDGYNRLFVSSGGYFNMYDWWD